MKTTFWLVASKSGNVRVFKNKPTMTTNDVAIRQVLEIPDAMFERPHFEIAVKVADDIVPREQVNEVFVNAADVLRRRGMEVEVKALPVRADGRVEAAKGRLL